MEREGSEIKNKNVINTKASFSSLQYILVICFQNDVSKIKIP